MGSISIYPIYYSKNYEASNLTSFESTDCWKYNMSGYHQITHEFTLKDTYITVLSSLSGEDVSSYGDSYYSGLN